MASILESKGRLSASKNKIHILTASKKHISVLKKGWIKRFLSSVNSKEEGTCILMCEENRLQNKTNQRQRGKLHSNQENSLKSLTKDRLLSQTFKHQTQGCPTLYKNVQN